MSWNVQMKFNWWLPQQQWACAACIHSPVIQCSDLQLKRLNCSYDNCKSSLFTTLNPVITYVGFSSRCNHYVAFQEWCYCSSGSRISRRGAPIPDAPTLHNICMSKRKNRDPERGAHRVHPLDRPLSCHRNWNELQLDAQLGYDDVFICHTENVKSDCLF